MKIIVIGHVIDTEYILRISSVEKDNNYWQTYFYIYFVNGEELEVRYHGSRKYPSRDIPEADVIEINRIRDEVIKYWEGSQTTLPTINFSDNSSIVEHNPD